VGTISVVDPDLQDSHYFSKPDPQQILELDLNPHQVKIQELWRLQDEAI
jgi:hypothetical protein